jgi:hypothetical protein
MSTMPGSILVLRLRLLGRCFCIVISSQPYYY